MGGRRAGTRAPDRGRGRRHHRHADRGRSTEGGTFRGVGIDMPIHPPVAGYRQADLAARAHLGPKASSIFPTGPRPVLDAPSYADGCAVARALDGRAISRQAYRITLHILSSSDKTQLPPYLIEHDSYSIREIEATAGGLHRNAHDLCWEEARQHGRR